ncbi:protein FAM92A-like [Actinia tenebrosa]|uniref:Protein FAM92A-like n=1 Tax=Actinia tenebrosa TaxID=6105 RepID=A0A6P8IAE2_ACTTE|nr:protein FAM92A-like [Actinia tenebrosa]
MKNASSSSASESRMEARARDHELKIVSDRIALAEKHFTSLSKDVLSYNASLEGVKEKGNKLSSSLDSYADMEYPSVRNAMQNVSECVATMQDYLTAEVNFLHGKVAQPLSFYATNCKIAKDYAKGAITARDKELAKLKSLDKMKSKDPNNKSKLAKLEQELQKASIDSGRARQTMVDQMVIFEKKKIEDLKSIFGSFFHGQLLFHAKALETYTQAYKHLMAIDEQLDLEAFENDIHPATIPTRLDSIKSGSQSSLHYDSQGSLRGSQLSLNRTSQSMHSQGSIE